MPRRFPALAAAAAAFASSASLAAEQPYVPSPPTIIASPFAMAVAGFDRDGDMRVTRAEYDEQVRRSFAASDVDRNGSIGLAEFSGWAERTLGNGGALPGPFDFDQDGDDRISETEFTRLFAARFAVLDKNADGVLLRSELVTLVASPPSRGKGRRGEGTPAQEQRRRLR